MVSSGPKLVKILQSTIRVTHTMMTKLVAKRHGTKQVFSPARTRETTSRVITTLRNSYAE